LVWFGLVSFDLIWFGLVWFGGPQTGSGAHLTSYPIYNRGSYPEGKAVGA